MTTKLKKSLHVAALVSALALPAAALVSVEAQAAPETYVLDTKANHAFIQFKIKHLGYSWLLGEFKTFTGEFTLDPDAIEKSSVKAEIDVASVDTNHAERDKHLRSADFFDVEKFPKATFVSTSVKKTGDKTADVTGNFTLKGVTKPITLKATYIGGGDDPWGGHRQGFELTGEIVLKDFNINYNLGPASQSALIYISAEGVKK
ncbi:MAG TPA: YceI family protein [Pseudomonadales bacterium]|nr:YceI family protein [Pseudomonadales bacterium]